MALSRSAINEGGLALGCAAVAMIGFAVDGSVLTMLEHAGVAPAWARICSLACAMQVTFLVNGRFVFRCVTRRNLFASWAGYMASSGLGNFCNYWAFLTLVSLHSPVWSNRWLDLVIGGVTAWSIKYVCARFLVFRREGEGGAVIEGVLDQISKRLGLRAPRVAGPLLITGSGDGA